MLAPWGYAKSLFVKLSQTVEKKEHMLMLYNMEVTPQRK